MTVSNNNYYPYYHTYILSLVGCIVLDLYAWSSTRGGGGKAMSCGSLREQR